MNKFYITTAIPYVNAPPHIGNVLDFIYADILARYYRQNGIKDVLFVTGTDEHGSKIAEKAKAAGQTPQAFVDINTQAVIDTLKILNISNDRFIRTTDPAHIDRVNVIWNNLAKFIYKGQYVGLYCVGCEEYVTETTAKANNMICPIHNRPYERLVEENYFFALSKFSKAIKTAIDNGDFKIVPETHQNEIISLLESGLEDISISRPVDKLAWGIPVPNDKSQVIYVWLDALLNYITALGYPKHKDFATFWPADVQIIGIDVLRFHAAFWPAILMALNLPLPKLLFVHGYVYADGQKMSKTIGNVVTPSTIVDKYGCDAYRYYFSRHMSSYENGNFTWELMDKAYNNELANELGNAVQRVVGMLVMYQNNIIGEIPPAEHDVHEYQAALIACRFDQAMNEVWDQVRGLNQYIDTEKPWVIKKNNDDLHLQEVLAYATSCLLEIAALLRPFMPETAAKIDSIFKEGIVKPLDKPLFPKNES